MKAITVTQPYASLIAAKYKLAVTRDRPTNHRGPVAIHAARKSPSESIVGVDADLRAVSGKLPGTKVIDDLWRTPYPLGAVIAVADIVDCVRVSPEVIDDTSPLELALGDWRSDRYAWELANVRPITPVVWHREARDMEELDEDTSIRVNAELTMMGWR